MWKMLGRNLYEPVCLKPLPPSRLSYLKTRWMHLSRALSSEISNLCAKPLPAIHKQNDTKFLGPKE